MHKAYWLSALAFCFLCSGAIAQPGSYTLQSNRLTVDFQTVGSSLELVSIQNSALNGLPILFDNSGQSSAGAWRIILRDRIDSQLTQQIDMSTPGLTLFTMKLPFGVNGEALFAEWTGSFVDLNNNSVEITVAVAWIVDDDSGDYAYAAIAVDIPGMAGRSYYMSRLEFPRVALATIGDPQDTHQLVLPFLSGLRVKNPVGGMRLPSPLRNPSVPFTDIPLFGYYNESSGDCLYFGDADSDRYWKTYMVDNPDDHLVFNIAHLPDDVLNRSDWTVPYVVRVGALQGDWVTLADAYRTFLATTDWYHGPVGSTESDMPEEMKSIVAQAVFKTGTLDDAMDGVSRDTWNAWRIFGDGVYGMWYDGYYPDLFDSFYFKGYLPGRPSFSAAVQEAQKQGGHLVAPYILGTAGVDYEEAGLEQPTEINLAIKASFVVGEDGQSFRTPTAGLPMYVLCNGAALWSTIFVNNLLDVAELTRMRAVYLDWFGTSPCYSTEHANHSPGGGNWMYTERGQQLQDVAAGVASLGVPYFGTSMESAWSYLTEGVHLANLTPLNQAIAQWPSEPFDDGNTVTIPFFRVSHDNVKISRIAGLKEDPDDPGRSAWLVANEVFNFGQLPNWHNGATDIGPSFYDRRSASFYRFLTRITQFLRDQDFLKFHNGTMRRQPPFVVTAPTGFQGVTAANPDMLAPYMREYLATGIFLAPVASSSDPELAFVAANPWVGTNQATMTLDFTFDPSDYDIANPGQYNVTYYDDSGVASGPSMQSGPYVVNNHQVMPGEIVYWTFQ